MKFTYNEEQDVYINDETGETISADGFFDEYFVCEECGEAFRYDEDEYADCDGHVYCNECAGYNGYVQCWECGSWIRESNATIPVDANDRYYCTHCAERELSFCEDCGDAFVYDDNLLVDPITDSRYCEHCYPIHCPIDTYHTFKNDGEYHFYGCSRDDVRTNSPYLGFELEVDDGCSVREALDAIKRCDFPSEYFHFESDGSLNDGFEIISQPASINYHIQKTDEYAKAWNGVVSAGYSSHDAGTCGLHVHVDRAYFEDKEDSSIAKILFIMERHWDNLVKFSRRKNSQMHWCYRYGSSPTSIVKDSKKSCYGRYYALNLTNDETIEFRLWRGTLNINTFMATLKLTARICEIAKHTPAVVLAKMTWDDILGDDEAVRTYWNTRTGNNNNQ